MRVIVHDGIHAGVSGKIEARGRSNAAMARHAILLYQRMDDVGKLLLQRRAGGVGRFGHGNRGDGKNSGGETQGYGEWATWHVRTCVDYTGPGKRKQGSAGLICSCRYGNAFFVIYLAGKLIGDS